MSAPRLNILRRTLHWVVAILVLLMLPGGLIFTDFDNKPAVEGVFGAGAFDALYDVHKATGVLVLALASLRILSLLIWPAPAYEPNLPGAQRVVAKATHGAIYVLLFLTPLLGWMGASAFPAPVPFYGFGEMPALAPANREMSRFLLDLHQYAAFTLAAVIVAHICAALYHRNVRQDGVFRRITLW